MKVLVLNCGSSSVKFQLIDTDEHATSAKGVISKIGMPGALLSMEVPERDKVKISGEILDHTAAIENILHILVDKEYGVISNTQEIEAIGHRVVHGGEYFSDSVMIDDDTLKKIEECIDYAPLHNPHNIKGINACKRVLPGVPMVGVFDTAFHHSMPDYAYIYGIPYVLYKRYGIRRYGFHGTSHYYVSRRAQDMIGKPMEELNVITCHLGNGSSIAAVRGGVSVDTSMGFTPLEGLMMGTRSGDIDPSIVLQVMAREELSSAEISTMLNKHSGMIGISGTSSDMQDILESVENGDKQAKLALDVFCYRLKKYIGSYFAVLGSVDALVFTGGIGENSALVRKKTLEDMAVFGIEIDVEKNDGAAGQESTISRTNSRVTVLTIPTNEELVIAIDTEMIIKRN